MPYSGEQGDAAVALLFCSTPLPSAPDPAIENPLLVAPTLCPLKSSMTTLEMIMLLTTAFVVTLKFAVVSCTVPCWIVLKLATPLVLPRINVPVPVLLSHEAPCNVTGQLWGELRNR